MVGKKGANIRAAEAVGESFLEELGYQPRVRVDVEGGEVTIKGDTEEVVEAARCILELVQVEVPLADDDDEVDDDAVDDDDDDDDDDDEKVEKVEVEEEKVEVEEEGKEEEKDKENDQEKEEEKEKTKEEKNEGENQRQTDEKGSPTEKPKKDLRNAATKWLLVNKGGAIRELESSCGLLRVNVRGNKVVLMGSAKAVAEGQEWLEEHGTPKVLNMSEDECKWLLSDKGAQLRGMEQASGLLSLDVQRGDNVMTMHGSENAIDIATRWFEANTTIFQKPLTGPQVVWFRSKRAQKIQALEQATGVSCLDYPTNQGGEVERILRLMGKPEAIDRAKAWIVSELPTTENGGVCELQIDPDLFGTIVGKKGAHLAELREETGIHEIDLDKETGRVLLLGNSSSVEKAKLEVDISMEVVPVVEIQIAWLLSNGASNIRALESSAGLYRIDLDKEKKSLTMIGNKSSVFKGTLWIELHMAIKRIPLSEVSLSLNPNPKPKPDLAWRHPLRG